MKTKTLKKALGLAGLGLGVALLSSCTANFCSQNDLASIAYPYDQGVTVYLTKAEFDDLRNNGDKLTKAIIEQEMAWSDQAEALGLPRIAGQTYASNERIYQYVPYICEATVDETTGEFNYLPQKFVSFSSNKASGLLTTILKSAVNAKYRIPSVYYFGALDHLVLDHAIATAFPTDTDAKKASLYVGSEADLGLNYCVNAYNVIDPSTDQIEQKLVKEISNSQSILRGYGKYKFAGVNEKGEAAMWGNFDILNDEIAVMSKTGFAPLGVAQIMGSDFEALYKTQVNTKVNNIRSCIATRDNDDGYGHYGTSSDWRVRMDTKDWGYAWSKGFLEGLLVYPVSWLLDTFAYGMDPALSGMGQIFALIFVTLIVRGILLLVSFRSTMDNQKTQAIQPELAKIQAKYPNANTNQNERQRLSQEQMALYKRHGIHPMRQILILIIQFPVFICVWSGLQGAATLATGEVLNVRLSDTIQSILFNTNGLPSNIHGWWTALILFLLMAAVQVFAMLLPRIIAKRATKNVGKLTANPAANQQGKTMKWVTYGMMIFTIIMGFMLPSAMGVYWLIGGLISIIQTLITQLILSLRKKRK